MFLKLSQCTLLSGFNRIVVHKPFSSETPKRIAPKQSEGLKSDDLIFQY